MAIRRRRRVKEPRQLVLLLRAQLRLGEDEDRMGVKGLADLIKRLGSQVRQVDARDDSAKVRVEVPRGGVWEGLRRQRGEGDGHDEVMVI